MNKKLLISLGLVMAVSAAVVPAFADTTIYTDGIGRLHFLGRDASTNVSNKNNYTNPAEQELTRKLYSEPREATYDDSFNQHPVKNYENTFPDSRFTTTSFWKKQYENNAEAAKVNTEDLSNVDTSQGIPTTSERPSKKAKKTTVEASQGARYGNNPYIQNLNSNEEGYTNVIQEKTTKKKHWWNKNK